MKINAAYRHEVLRLKASLPALPTQEVFGIARENLGDYFAPEQEIHYHPHELQDAGTVW